MDILKLFMKTIMIYRISILILILVVISRGLYSQVVISEKSTIHINTQDGSLPEIKIIEPNQLKQDETFVTERQSITIAMRLLNPEKGVKVYLNYIELLPTSAGDIFLRNLDLNKGSNLINISIHKDDKMIKGYEYTMVYIPPVKNISPHALNPGKYYALIIATITIPNYPL